MRFVSSTTLKGIFITAALTAVTLPALAQERSLFDRNRETLRNAERDGRVSRDNMGPDRGPMPRDQQLGGGGFGGGRGGGNEQGGPNQRAINERNQ